MTTSYKKNVLLSLAISVGLFVIFPAGLIFMADHCHIFHKPIKGIFDHGFTGDLRCQNAGLINNYLENPQEHFDSVFTGTSLSGNFLPEHLADKTPWKRTLKLTFPGARPIEQQIVTERALATGNVSHVFWEVFPYQFLLFPSVEIKKMSDADDFPLYLYNSSRLDDYRYLLRMSTLVAAIGVIYGENYYNISPIEHIDYWQHECTAEKTCKPFHDAKSITQIKAAYTQPHFSLLAGSEVAAIDYSAADRYLLDTLMPYCNKNVSFDLFFPPVSMLWFARQGAAEFDYQLYMLRYVVNKTAACKNIRVYAFNNELWITGDLAHYHDPRHFYGGVQDYIIDAMGVGKHIITMDNIDEFEKHFVENVNAYVPWASTEEQLRNSSH
jgi:hypothetical protein